ncbi:MAG: hypothetical protein FJX76_07440 [Armatimonadetes bacterium]|nr:hypothetical protein [Armatimonadota bacterium]
MDRKTLCPRCGERMHLRRAENEPWVRYHCSEALCGFAYLKWSAVRPMTARAPFRLRRAG